MVPCERSGALYEPGHGLPRSRVHYVIVPDSFISSAQNRISVPVNSTYALKFITIPVANIF